MSYNKHERYAEVFSDDQIDFIVDDEAALTFGLHYAPDPSDYFTESPAEKNVQFTDLSSTTGGSFFDGAIIKSKTIKVRSFFYVDEIHSGFLSDCYNHYYVGRKCNLYFTTSPYIEYTAVISKTYSEQINIVAGMFTIEFIVPSGIGRFRNAGLETTDERYNNFINSSGYFRGIDFANTSYNTKTITMTGTQVSTYLYNPGTKNAPLKIEITGSVSNGFTIANANTKKKIIFRAFNTANLPSPYTKIVVDCAAGKVYMADANDTVAAPAYIYHRTGMLYIQGVNKTDCGTLRHVTGGGTSHVFSCDKFLTGNFVGRIIGYIGNDDIYFYKIDMTTHTSVGTSIGATEINHYTGTWNNNEDTKIVSADQIVITPGVSGDRPTIKFTWNSFY